MMSMRFRAMRTRNGENDRVPVTVRIPGHILEQIDSSLEQAELPISRNHWIVEALVEKLKRYKAWHGDPSNGAG